MARARRVRGIRPGRSLIWNGRRVIATRLNELLEHSAALTDPANVTDLHNMRIAAKRVRYALEFLDICFDDTKQILRDLADMQEDLGTIHDLDVMQDMLRARLQALDAQLEPRVFEIMAGDLAPRAKGVALRRLVLEQARDPRRLGLLGLIGSKAVDRAQRFHAFVERWGGGRLDEWADQVRQVTGLEVPDREESAGVKQERSDETELIVSAGFPHVPPARLYAFWTDPKLLESWWPPEAELDVRPGGQYHLSWPKQNWHLRGHYVEVEPPQRLVFTWQWDHESPLVPTHTVAVNIVPDGEAGSRLSLRQGPYGLSEGEQHVRLQEHLVGWTHFLSVLQTATGSGTQPAK